METSNELFIKQFDLKQLCSNPAILIIAKRGSGKTWVCRSLLEHLRTIPVGVIISKSENTDPFFSEFFPSSFIYDGYEPKIFSKILARQKAIREKAEAKRKEGKKIDTRLFLLMDDCLSDSKTWTKDENLKDILFNGRHYDITYILTMQYPIGITPELRTNFDYVFLLYTDIVDEQTKFYKYYTGMFPNFGAFKQVYLKLSESYGVMVVVKRNAGRNLNDKIYHYRSKKIQPKTIGCRQFIKFHEINYDKNWAKREAAREFDPSSLVRSKNNFVVKKIDINGKQKFD
jgi:hypothetical protein